MTPPLLRARQTVAGLLALSVLVLAVLAGRFLFGQGEIDLHGYLGNGVFVLALVNVGLAVATRHDRPNLTLSVLVLLGVFAQIGLGYSGRESTDAASWHVPNGVLVMGLCAFQIAWLLAPRRAEVAT